MKHPTSTTREPINHSERQTPKKKHMANAERSMENAKFKAHGNEKRSIRKIKNASSTAGETEAFLHGTLHVQNESTVAEMSSRWKVWR